MCACDALHRLRSTVETFYFVHLHLYLLPTSTNSQINLMNITLLVRVYKITSHPYIIHSSLGTLLDQVFDFLPAFHN